MIKAILFDAGDTVVEDQPLTPGSMADWVTINETPGIRTILESMHSKYDLMMATNAAISGEKQVRKALARVQLDGYFSYIYTARELGLSKPDPEFYRTILRNHNLRPEEIVMVGDSLINDALGAADAGLRSIWLHRENELLHTHPSFDGELVSFDHWEPVFCGIETGQIPSMGQVRQLLKEYPPSPGLFRHVQRVALASYFIGQFLLLRGIRVSPILAHRAGLLHDIDKGVYRDSGIPHAEMGAQILTRRGLVDIAEIVRRHQVFSVINPELAPSTWEQRIVYLADKYIEKDQFVGLDERFTHFRSRYPDSTSLFNEAYPFAVRLENEVLAALSMSREGLYAELTGKIQRIPLYEK